MNVKKRGLALLLTLVMCLSVMSIEAFAANHTITDDATWDAAVTDIGAQTSGTHSITVSSGVSVTGTLMIPSGVTVNLVLNGMLNVTPDAQSYAIENHGTLTIRGDGTLDATAAAARYGAVYNTGRLTINGATITAAETSKIGVAVYNNGSGTANLSGGSYSGWCAAYNNSGTMNINGGMYSSETGAVGTARSYTVREMNGALTISGNTTVTGGHGAVAVSAGTLTINGGTFEATPETGYCALYLGAETGDVTGYVYGGRFSTQRTCPAIWVGNTTSTGGAAGYTAVLTIYETFAQSNGGAAIDTLKSPAHTSETSRVTPDGKGSIVFFRPSTGGGSVSTQQDGTVLDNGPAVPLTELPGEASNTTTVVNSDGTKTTTTQFSDGGKRETTEKTVNNSDGSSTTTTTEKYTAADGTVIDGKSTSTTKTNAATGETTTTTVKSMDSSDGSKTETKSEVVEKTDGSSVTTSTEVATNTEGGVTTTETETVYDAAGSYTMTEKITDPEGSTGTSVVKDGSTVSARLVITEVAAVKAAGEEDAVAAPVNVIPAEKLESAGLVEVLFENDTAADVTKSVNVPVADSKTTTVAYIKKADGTLELMKDCAVSQDGVAVILNHDAELVFVENPKTFTDEIPAWAVEDAKFVSSREIVNGIDGEFRGNTTTSRGMIAQMLYNYDKESDQSNAKGSFGDAADKWFDDAASWANSVGVVLGDNGRFRGDDNVTRQELAAIIYRYADKVLGADMTLKGTANTFPDDSSVAPYAKDAMHWCIERGIINGMEGRLEPTGDATRAQVSAMMARMIKNVVHGTPTVMLVNK